MNKKITFKGADQLRESMIKEKEKEIKKLKKEIKELKNIIEKQKDQKKFNIEKLEKLLMKVFIWQKGKLKDWREIDFCSEENKHINIKWVNMETMDFHYFDSCWETPEINKRFNIEDLNKQEFRLKLTIFSLLKQIFLEHKYEMWEIRRIWILKDNIKNEKG